MALSAPRRLRAFVVADLSIDIVPVRTHVRPGAGKVFRLQPRIEAQQVGLVGSEPPGSGATNVYTAELDAKLNAAKGPSISTDVSINSNRSGAWSPDGEFLAYSSETTRGVVIRIRSLKTGEDREVPTQVAI